MFVQNQTLDFTHRHKIVVDQPLRKGCLWGQSL